MDVQNIFGVETNAFSFIACLPTSINVPYPRKTLYAFIPDIVRRSIPDAFERLLLYGCGEACQTA